MNNICDICGICVRPRISRIKLSILDNYTLDTPEDIAKEIANDFRKRRIEKNITRDQLAESSGVAVSNIVRFEQKGLISLKNLIGIAMALGYTSELKNLLSQRMQSHAWYSLRYSHQH